MKKLLQKHYLNAGLKTMASPWTKSGHDDHLSGQKFHLPVILNGPVNKGPKIYLVHCISRGQASISQELWYKLDLFVKFWQLSYWQSPLNSCIPQHSTMKASYSHFLLCFYQLLDLLHLCAKFLQKSMLGSFTACYNTYRILRVCKEYLESCCYEFG